MEKVIFKDLGLIDYKEAWDYQENIFNGIIEQKVKNRNLSDENKIKTDSYLLFCEHPHVYTLGKSGEESNLLIDFIQMQAKNATFYKTNRGGDITYHGPGQIVGYPILDLDNFIPDIHKYIYLLEESIIETIKVFGLKGERLNGATGVWIDPMIQGKARKICAIGVRTSRWVTMHGFAFNVNTDLSYFNYINPCGFVDKGVTSIQKELNENINIDEVKEILRKNIAKLFGMELVMN
ncbi:MAG: lipoyl(octanoyl) transferase LipB [Bacteroidota bacterium]|nr:lipoyl(octanoyl) transferase LipB [Bacteroidota bacterium]